MDPRQRPRAMRRAETVTPLDIAAEETFPPGGRAGCQARIEGSPLARGGETGTMAAEP